MFSRVEIITYHTTILLPYRGYIKIDDHLKVSKARTIFVLLYVNITWRRNLVELMASTNKINQFIALQKIQRCDKIQDICTSSQKSTEEYVSGSDHLSLWIPLKTDHQAEMNQCLLFLEIFAWYKTCLIVATTILSGLNYKTAVTTRKKKIIKSNWCFIF